MPDNTSFDPWDSLAESLGAKPAADTPQLPPSTQPPPSAQTRSREKPPIAKQPPAEPASGGWDALADSLGIAPAPVAPPRPTQPRRAAESAQPRAERPPVRDTTEERQIGSRDARSATSWQDDELPPRRPVSDGLPERLPSEGRGEGRDEPRGEGRGEPRGEGRDEPRGEGRGEGRDDGEGRGRRRRGRRGGRGRRRDDDRPASAGGEPRTDSATDDLRVREPREFDQAREVRPERPARRSEEPRSGDRSREDEPAREGRRRLPAHDDFESLDTDGERSHDEQGFDDIDNTASSDQRNDGDAGRRDDESQPRPRRRRGRRGGRSRVRGRGDAPPAGNADRPAGARDADDEPLPASYGSRTGGRPESSTRGEDGRRPPIARETTEGASEESAGPTRGRRRRRRGDAPRTGSDEPRKSGTPVRRESTRPRSADARRGRSGEARTATPSRSRRDDFAPVSGRYDEDDEGLEFLGVEEAVRDAAPRARSVEDDDVLTESGLISVLDVPSWVEAIGIVIAGNLAGRSSRGGRADGGNDRGR